MSISSYLKQLGHTVRIIDLNLLENASDSYFATMLKQENADIYGFSIAAGTVHSALGIAKKLKELKPTVTIVFGGPQATLNHELILKNFRFIDVVIRGEGEETFGELVETISHQETLSKIRGITWRDSTDRIICNDERSLICNLDSLPIPDYSQYDYKKMNINVIPLEVGRGCPYSCSFCSSSVLWQRKYRVKSIERIIDEMKLLIREYSVRLIYFRHDQIVLNRTWFITLCQRIKKENLNVRWQCSARIDTVDNELLEIMSASGCIGIECGIETLSSKVQYDINKNLNIKQIIANLHNVVANNINPVLFFMCGFPNEDKSELNITLNGIIKLICSCNNPTFFQLRVLQPFPHTMITDSNIDKLIFYPQRLSGEVLKKYPKNLMNFARNCPELFPEFYYIMNKYDISFNEFLFLEKAFNSYIRYLNSTFFLTFKYFAFLCDWNYELIFRKLNICNNTIYTETEIETIFEEVTLSFPKSIQAIFSYEKDINFVKKNWTSKDTKLSKSKYYLNPNVWFFAYPTPIKEIIMEINNNPNNISDSNKETIMMMIADGHSLVRTYTINNELQELLISFKKGLDKADAENRIDPQTIKYLIDKGAII